MPGDSSLKTAGRWRAVKRLLSASVITVLEVQLDGDSFSAGLVHTEHSRSVDINIYIYIYIHACTSLKAVSLVWTNQI